MKGLIGAERKKVYKVRGRQREKEEKKKKNINAKKCHAARNAEAKIRVIKIK